MTAPRKPVALSEGTWPQVWSGCIKDAAVQNCTPEWLLWKRITALEAERDEARMEIVRRNADMDGHPGMCCGQCVKAIVVAETERDRFKQQRDNEAWMHAACLSIAEGAPGWEQPSTTDSAAMTAVRRLRQERDALRAECARVERERDGVRGLLDAAVVLGAERTIERDALRAEVEAWRSYDDGCEHGDLLDMSVQHLEEARRLRAQNEGGARGCGGD
jgi:hypothetical protein